MLKTSVKLSKGLENLTKAPLKPQQRIFVLRVHLLHQLYHELVLGGIAITKSLLCGLDRAVRKSIRMWLRLPHDTPTAFFHAAEREGGLNIPQLLYRIPILKRDRSDRLVMKGKKNDAILQAII